MILTVGPRFKQMVTAADMEGCLSGAPEYYTFVRPVTGPAIADVIDLIMIHDPATPWPNELNRPRRPTILLIGDDPGTPWGRGGPAAWRCTSRLRHWARAALVHGAGGEPEHYAEAVRAARQVGQVVIAETTSEHAPAWAAAIRCKRTLVIIPRQGAHPCQPAEAMQ